MPSDITAETAPFCYLDLDFDDHRKKRAMVAAFVDATDARYGFSSKDLRQLGGSELARIPDLIASDHEWSSRAAEATSTATTIGSAEIRPPPAGNRIVLRLDWVAAPLACENFATLCSNGSVLPNGSQKKARPAPVGESGKPLTYRDSVVHRSVPGFVVQGGDFVFGNGSGGESVFGGKKFKDERAGLQRRHDRRGILSMGNSGKNSNTSQWFLTFAAAPQCDAKHVAFGEVVSGWEVLDEAERSGTADGEPRVRIVVTDCGVWVPFLSPGCGYWFDRPDLEAYAGISPVFVVRPRVALVVPSATVLDRFAKGLAGQCSLTPVLITQEEFEGDNAAPTRTMLARRLSELLAGFAVDVVLVAPACRSLVMDDSSTPTALSAALLLPPSWTKNGVPFEDVVLEAKPVDALATIHTRSWLATKTSWYLEGAA